MRSVLKWRPTFFQRIMLGMMIQFFFLMSLWAAFGSQQLSFFAGGLLLVMSLPVFVLVSWWVAEPLIRGIAILENGLSSFREGDFHFRTPPPRQRELRQIFELFNEMGSVMASSREYLYQKELMLDQVIESAPMAIILLGPGERIILANPVARVLLQVDRSLLGMAWSELLAEAPAAFVTALAGTGDVLFSMSEAGDSESYLVSQQIFDLNGIDHRLVLIKHLTRELRRQEVVTWKKLIRLINHEINNVLAPISTQLNLARKIVDRPDKFERLGPILDSVQKTTRHLTRFLDDYATFARLPLPRPQPTKWTPFFHCLLPIFPFQMENLLSRDTGYFDADQLQQVMVNLIKNAIEADPQGAAPRVRLTEPPQGGTLIEVIDRGNGMSAETMEKALLPFYSTKKSGTGLGLPLCREILESHHGNISIKPNADGGMCVLCWLPPEPAERLGVT